MRPATRVVVAVAFAVAFFATRLPRLTLLPVFVDEALHILLARDIAATGKLIGSDSGKYLPLWLLAPVVSHAADPLRAARLCSVVYGLLTALGLFLLARELRDERAGLLAAGLYLVVPWTLFFDRMALVDTLLSCLVVWTLLVAIRWAGAPRIPWALALGLLLGLAGLTKLYGLMLLVVPGALAVLWPGPGRAQRLKHALLSYAVAAAIVWPITGGLPIHLQYAAERLRFLRQGATPYPAFGTLGAAARESIQYLTLPAALLAGAGMVGAIVRRDLSACLALATWACWFLLFTAVGTGWSPRYLLPGTVPLLAVAAAEGMRLADSAGARLRRGSAGVALGLLGLVAWAAFPLDAALLTDPSRAPLPDHDRLEYVEGLSAGYGIPEVTAFLRSRAGNGRLVVLRDARSGPLLEGLDLYLEQNPARLRFVQAYYEEGVDLPTADELAAEPDAAYVLRQRPTTPKAPIELGPRFVLDPVAIIPKPGGDWQLEIYRVERR